jgi:hypothetical chaperone protein
MDLHCIERDLGAVLDPQALSQGLQTQLGQIVDCARACVAQAGGVQPDAIYLTGGSSALAPLGAAFKAAFPGSDTVTGDRFGSVAAGLATHGARQRQLLSLTYAG